MKAFQEIKHYLSDFKVWHNSHTNIDILAHWHDEIELIYITSGAATFVISNQRIEVATGDFIFCDKREIHYSLNHTPNTEFEFLIFDDSILSSYYQGILTKTHLLRSEDMDRYGLRDKWHSLVSLCDRELKNNDDYYKDIISCEIKSFYYQVTRIIKSTEEEIKVLDKKHRLDREFSSILSYIGENYSEKITLPQIANMLGFSDSHFSKLFKEQTGMGFSKYLNYIRVSNAAQLIDSKQMRMVDVASACGFETIRNFNRVFLSVAGCTPSQYASKETISDISFISSYRSSKGVESYTLSNPTIA